MDRNTFNSIEAYMLEMMKDVAHDSLHIYRVLHQALEIAENYNNVDKDILIASCLLHDIGRQHQFRDPRLCHAIEGGKMAYEFIKSLGWKEEQCKHVKDCIMTHRFRTDNQPKTLEAKILFDSDKLDVTGALGIARSLLYKGQIGEPIYAVGKDYKVRNGQGENEPESFLKEYHHKLIKVYDWFYTKEARKIALQRREITEKFYQELLDEIDINNLGELVYSEFGRENK